MGLVADRIHEDEPDTTEATVRTLLARHCPELTGLPLSYLQTSGSDNAMWRLHGSTDHDLVVRLPRRARAAAKIGQELELLRHLTETAALASVVHTPAVRYVGDPDDAFPHRWGVLDWLDGVDAWTARGSLHGDLGPLAVDIARTVRAIGRLPDMPVPRREPGDRGGPIAPLLRRLEWWLTDPRWGLRAGARRWRRSLLHASAPPARRPHGPHAEPDPRGHLILTATEKVTRPRPAGSTARAVKHRLDGGRLELQAGTQDPAERDRLAAAGSVDALGPPQTARTRSRSAIAAERPKAASPINAERTPERADRGSTLF